MNIIRMWADCRKNVVYLQGGLGNRMFQYAFYLLVKDRCPNTCCDGTLLCKENQHNGLELNSLFGITTITILEHTPFLLKVIYVVLVNRNFRGRNAILKILSFCGLHIIIDTMPSMYMPDVIKVKANRTHYFGYWQTENYFIHNRQKILEIFRFDEKKLSTHSKELSEKICNQSSVSIHIRRGDYLAEHNKRLYGDICTKDYYTKAIKMIQEKVQDANFYVFSDDVEWVKNNILIPNCTYVDWNKRKDSWQDMFLMSKCKHNIIANSTFSWWGAWLNENPDKIVICPSRFININQKSDIIPYGWNRIE